jgi:hypothetical protein
MQNKEFLTNKRTNIRVPTSAVSFIKDLDSVSGFIKDISTSGIRIEVQNIEERKTNYLNIGIPLLHNQEISGEIRWQKKTEGNDGNVQYGIEFKNLTDSQKKAIRKTILVDEPSLFQFIEEISNETCNPNIREKIKVFFLIEVKTNLERLIDLHCTKENDHSNAHDKEYDEILDNLRKRTKELGASLKNTILLKKIDQKIEQILKNFIKPEENFNSIDKKPAV